MNRPALDFVELSRPSRPASAGPAEKVWHGIPQIFLPDGVKTTYQWLPRGPESGVKVRHMELLV